MSCLGRLPRCACAQGSTAIVAGVLLLLLWIAMPAHAVIVTSHPFVTSFNGSDSTAGAFGPAARVAVSDATGSIYVIDPNNNVVDKFDASGVAQPFTSAQLPPGTTSLTGSNTPDLSFPSLSAEADVAVDNSGTASDGNIYVDSELSNTVYAFDATGSYLYKLTGFSDACGIAVAPSGNVWVADFVGSNVTEYTASGTPTGTSISTAGQGNPCHIAFDSSGNLYANLWQGAVQKYDPSGTYVGQVDAGPSYAVAVDRSNDHVYVDHGTDVAEYDASGTRVGTIGSGTLASSLGVAVDSSTGHPSSGHVVVSDQGSFLVDIWGAAITQHLPNVTTGVPSNVGGTTATVSGLFDPDGLSGTTCAFEYGTDTSYGSSVPCSPAPSGSGVTAVHADLSGLTPGTTYHYRLTGTSADGTNTGLDATFTTPAAPTVGSTSATPGSTSATLKATVNPQGAATAYHFEYGTTTSYGSSAPVSDASAGSGTSAKSVSVDVSGLQPSTTYHFRLVATNAAGTTNGPDATFATRAAVVADTCPNAQVRQQQGSAMLPDCRAWELVSQADKARSPLRSATSPSPDGHVLYSLLGGAPGSSNGSFPLLRAARTASGWASISMLPPASQLLAQSYLLGAATPNFDGAIISAFDGLSNSSPDIAIARLNAQGDQTLLHRFPQFFGTNGVNVATSDDLSHVYANVPEQIAPSHQPGTWNLYDFGGGSPQLVGTMPSTGLAPTCGLPVPTSSGPWGFVEGGVPYEHWTSTDGNLVFFMTRGDDAPGCGAPLELYVHDMRTGRSTLISGPPASGDPDNGVDRFLQATPSGSTVFFRTATSLTAADDADGNANDMDVYRWTASSGDLECVTCGVPQADVLPEALVSDDGSHVYFSSLAQFDGAPSGATTSTPNTYVWHDGTTGFVAQTDGISNLPFTGTPGQATPDGNAIVFRGDTADLNGRSRSDNGGTAQYYRYDDRDGTITCISCPTDGSPATVAAAPTLTGDAYAATVRIRVISDDGSTVVFRTAAALVPEDRNGDLDVYEWRDGRVGLVTSGTAQNERNLDVAGMSADGSDILFADIASLTFDAQDASIKLYDARVNGGFPAPPGSAPCVGDQCRGSVPGPPSLTEPAGPAAPGANAPAPARLTLAGITARQRALFARTGRLTLRARVNRGGIVSAVATAKLGRHAHTVARASKRASRAGTVTLTLRLSRAARAQLAHHRALRVVLVVRFTGAAGKRVTLTLVPANGR